MNDVESRMHDEDCGTRLEQGGGGQYEYKTYVISILQDRSEIEVQDKGTSTHLHLEAADKSIRHTYNYDVEVR